MKIRDHILRDSISRADEPAGAWERAEDNAPQRGQEGCPAAN